MSLCLSVALSWRNAVLVGVVFGAIILLWFGRTPLPDSAVISTSGHASLPAPYWIYWCALTMAVAIEFWYFAVGARIPTARRGLVGGIVRCGLRRFRSSHADRTHGCKQPSSRHRDTVTLSAGPAGHLSRLPHLLGTPAAINGLVGLFVLGLGVALLYPLTLGLAMGAARTRAGQLASLKLRQADRAAPHLGLGRRYSPFWHTRESGGSKYPGIQARTNDRLRPLHLTCVLSPFLCVYRA
jgi:hypothetical protein